MSATEAAGASPLDAYAVIPYEARPLAITHPVRLATAALRKGVRCAPPAACRMLDLGCADASNLLPLALSYPYSEFVGVERSASQVASARADIAALGLSNLRILEADLTDLGDLGPFDYIVAHGVFSWVSEAARAGILRHLADSLTPSGVGYLSYNAQPGWGVRGAVRDILRVHTRGVSDPREQIARARSHIGTLLGGLGAEADREPAAAFLAQVLEPLASRSDSYLLHEYLTEHNRAFAFSEIVASLGAHGLTVLSELLRATSAFSAHEGLAAMLEHAELPPGEVEAAIDLLTCRQFRASLVCHEAARPSLAVATRPEAWVTRCEITLAGPPAMFPGPDAGSCASSGAGPSSRRRASKAAAALANVWPGSLAIETLLERTCVIRQARASALDDLVRWCDLGYFELRSHVFPLVTQAGHRPVVSPLTRLDAGRGRHVTNQLHRSISLTPEAATLAGMLDGTRDLAGIARAWRSAPDSEAAPSEARVAGGIELLVERALLLG